MFVFNTIVIRRLVCSDPSVGKCEKFMKILKNVTSTSTRGHARQMFEESLEVLPAKTVNAESESSDTTYQAFANTTENKNVALFLLRKSGMPEGFFAFTSSI